MQKVYTKKDIDFSLKNYTFKCRKDGFGDNYIEKYIFDIPKPIHDMFAPYTNKFYIDTNCRNSMVVNLSTRIEKKTNKIIPIIECEKGIKLDPGNSIVNDIDEAKEILDKIYAYLEEKFKEIKQRKHEHDCTSVRDIVRSMVNDEIGDTSVISELKEKETKIKKQLKSVQNKIAKEHANVIDDKTLKVCNEIKENKYVIPEEDVEKFLCVTKYFEKSSIIQVVTEQILSIEEKRKDENTSDST